MNVYVHLTYLFINIIISQILSTTIRFFLATTVWNTVTFTFVKCWVKPIGVIVPATAWFLYFMINQIIFQCIQCIKVISILIIGQKMSTLLSWSKESIRVMMSAHIPIFPANKISKKVIN